ncbi:hypothetical protein ACFLS7_01130 [Bacteroidota bacterium]
MPTEENDHNIPPEARELFRNFEAEPPPEAWDAISARLAEEAKDSDSDQALGHLTGWLRPRKRLYPILVGFSLALIAFFIWIGVQPSSQINGQVSVDSQELQSGTAYLFKVQDDTSPFDSVRFVRQTPIDSTGHFLFSRLPSGSYLVRVYVGPESIHYPEYQHGYYGDQLDWNKAILIHTDQPQEIYYVKVPRLLRK